MVFILSALTLLSGAEEAVTVYVTNTGNRYHREGCASLSRSKNPISPAEAIKAGYAPCKICMPPAPPPSALSPAAAEPAAAQSASLYRVNAAGLTHSTDADTRRMIRAEVTGHVDGDTVKIRIANPPAELRETETIRLIGVDTPETVHPRQPAQFFGREASDFTKAQLLGKTIYLAFDWDLRDRYGRLLAYIYTPNGVCFNAALIREGYGHAYTTFSFQFMDEFRALEREAREVKRGLWNQ